MAYSFDWDCILGVLFGVPCILFGVLHGFLFGVLGVFFGVLGVFILWINFPKNSPFCVLCGKGTPAWKRYTTAGCGSCDNYEVWSYTLYTALKCQMLFCLLLILNYWLNQLKVLSKDESENPFLLDKVLVGSELHCKYLLLVTLLCTIFF